MTQLERADLIAGALTLDLTLLVPLLYYLLLVRWRGLPVVTVLPVFLVCAALAHWLIPDTHHQVLGVFSYVVALAELSVIGFLVYELLKLRHAFRQRTATGLDVPTALRESASEILGLVAGNALAYEVALFWFAVAGWRRSQPSPPESLFSYHRASAYVPFAIGIMIALVIETVAVHALLRLWAPARALGPYGFPRQVSMLDLQLDEAERFDAALKQAGCNVL